MDSNDTSQYNEFRKKRVKIFKRLIVFVIGFFIVLPNVLSLFSFVLLYKTDSTIKEMKEELYVIKNTETTQIAAEETKAVMEEKKHIDEDFVLKISPDSEEYEGYQRIYLTFDDGPSQYTGELLDLLNEYNVKATFFVLAQEGYDKEYNRIINEGHTLGIHSYDHVYNELYADSDGFKNDVNKIYDFIEQKTGITPRFYRFPGGSSNTIYKGDKNELIDFLNEKNLIYYDWNVTSNDATFGGLSKGQIANNVLSGIEGKDDCVILMHDANDKHSTIEALELIFKSLESREDVIFLPITENTQMIQHIKRSE